MAGTESTSEGERGGQERGQAQRQSRRAQGLPPEEAKTLDELKKERRHAIAAKRKVPMSRRRGSHRTSKTSLIRSRLPRMRTTQTWTPALRMVRVGRRQVTPKETPAR
jgi:hypothetical protein